MAVYETKTTRYQYMLTDNVRNNAYAVPEAHLFDEIEEVKDIFTSVSFVTYN